MNIIDEVLTQTQAGSLRRISLKMSACACYGRWKISQGRLPVMKRLTSLRSIEAHIHNLCDTSADDVSIIEMQHEGGFCSGWGFDAFRAILDALSESPLTLATIYIDGNHSWTNMATLFEKTLLKEARRRLSETASR